MGLIFFTMMSSFGLIAQCSQSDIVVTTNATWTNQDIQLTENQKITVTAGATLTLENCTLRRKTGCSGYWDGIYLVTAENGDKAGLIVKEGTRIEFSKRGIQALNGFSQITLDEAEMSDNGQMINARDNWPFLSFTGNFTSNNSSRDGGAISVYDIGCGGEWNLSTPTPPKVIIRNNSILKVTENGNVSVTPAKYTVQISALGAEVHVVDSEIENGQSLYHLVAIASSRGKCKIFGESKIDGFWFGVYKGTDASAFCVSEGLVLTGSRIINTDLIDGVLNGPGFAVYNVSADVMIKGNLLDGNVWSYGTSYGSIIGNNIYYEEDPDVSSTSVSIVGPRESFVIFDNGFYETPIEFEGNNSQTYTLCNTWIEETYAAVAGYHNIFPMSWGTTSFSAGNVWDITQSEMYNLSFNDDQINYYHQPLVAHEVFNWFVGFEEKTAIDPNSNCTYEWPANATELDPEEFERDIEDLEDEYLDIQSQIESIIGHMDTTLVPVKEHLAYLKSRLSDLVGQGLLFHTTVGDEFWTEEIDPKVVELLGLNYLWYGRDMFSITEHLESNPDTDAEALYEAADKMSDYLDHGKNLINLTALQVDTLQDIAESSYGDYTNILRNYLFMVYDIFIPWERQSPLDSLRSIIPLQRPTDKPDYVVSDHTVSPNPFTDIVQIQANISSLEENINHIFVYNIEGKLLYTTTIDVNSGQINLSGLEPGVYFLKLENISTGKIEIKRIFKDQK